MLVPTGWVAAGIVFCMEVCGLMLFWRNQSTLRPLAIMFEMYWEQKKEMSLDYCGLSEYGCETCELDEKRLVGFAGLM